MINLIISTKLDSLKFSVLLTPSPFASQVALLLIRHGADVDVQDKEGYTVLGRATSDFRPALIDAAKAMLED